MACSPGLKHPSTSGNYEILDGAYVTSADTTVDSSKTYYTRSAPWQAILVYFGSDGLCLSVTSWLLDGGIHAAPSGTTSCAAIVKKTSGGTVVMPEAGDAALHVSPYTNADGTTATNDIVHRASSLEQDLDGITTRVGKTEMHIAGTFATSSTAAGTAAKVATITPTVSGWTLESGVSVTVKFTAANTALAPTLNVNSTGAKAIRDYTGAALAESAYKWAAGTAYTFTYDGAYWRLQDSALVARVSTAESSITQNAEAIEAKVSQDGVIAAINLSAEGARIQASKVEIDRTAIFGAISPQGDAAIADAADTLATLSYDHTWTLANGTYMFTGYAYRGGEDISDTLEDEFWTWMLRTEAGETQLPCGRVLTLSASSAGYRASVVGGLLEAAEVTITNAAGNALTDAAGNALMAFKAIS